MRYVILGKKFRGQLMTIRFQDHIDKRITELRERERELKKGSLTIKNMRIRL